MSENSVNESNYEIIRDEGINLRESKEYEKALKIFYKLLKYRHKDVRILNDIALTYLYLQEYDKSIKVLRKSRRLEPSNPYIDLYNGRVYFCLKIYEKSCDFFDESIKKFEKKIEEKKIKENDRAYSEAIYEKGLSYLKLDEENKAKKEFEKSLEIFKSATDSQYEALNYQGLVLRELARLENNKKDRIKKYDEAKASFNQAIELDRKSNSDNGQSKSSSALSNKGQLLHDLKKYREAIDLFNKAIKIDPFSVAIRNNKGVTQYSLGNYADSIRTFDESLEINSIDTNALNNKGLAFYALGRYKEAEEAFKQVISLNDKDPDAWNNKGLVLYEIEMFEEALKDFQKAIDLNHKNCSALNNKILTLAALGKKKDFLQAFEEAKGISSNESKAWNYKALGHCILNEYEEAIKDFEKATEDSAYTEALKNEALTLKKCNKKRAIYLFRKLIRIYSKSLDPDMDDTHTFNEIGFAYHKLGCHKGAIKNFKKALKINPQYAESWNNIGISFRSLQKYDDALEAFQKATDINPVYVEAWVNKGLTLYSLKSYKEGTDALRKAKDLVEELIKLNQKNHRAWYHLGLIFYNMNMYEESLQAFEKATISESKESYFWNNKGLSWYSLGVYEEAIKDLKKATELNPMDIYVWNNLGLANFNLGHYYEAINVFDRALSLDPSYLPSIYYKGLSLLEVKRYKEAEEVFEKIINYLNIYSELNRYNDLTNIRLHAYLNIRECCESRGIHSNISEEICKKETDINAHSPHNWNKRGVLFSRCDQSEKAKGTVINSSTSYDWNAKGVLFSLCGQCEKALEAFENAIYFQDDYIQAWYYKGITFYEIQWYDEALRAFLKVIELDPFHVDAWNYKGITLIELKRYEEAKDAFENAILINPKETLALINLGRLLLNFGDIEGANKKITEALNEDIKDKAILSAAWCLKGQIETEGDKPDYQEAIKSFKNAIYFNPKDVSVVLWHAYARYILAELFSIKEESSSKGYMQEKETGNNSKLGSNHQNSNENTKYEQEILSIIRDLEKIPLISFKSGKKLTFPPADYFIKYINHLIHIMDWDINIKQNRSSIDKAKQKLITYSIKNQTANKSLIGVKEYEAHILYFQGYFYYKLKDYSSAQERLQKCLSLKCKTPAKNMVSQLKSICDYYISPVWWKWWLSSPGSRFGRFVKKISFFCLLLVLLILLVPSFVNVIYNISTLIFEHITSYSITSEIPLIDELMNSIPSLSTDWEKQSTRNIILTALITFILLSPYVKRVGSDAIEIEMPSPTTFLPTLYPTTPPSGFAKESLQLHHPKGIQKSLLPIQSPLLPSAELK